MKKAKLFLMIAILTMASGALISCIDCIEGKGEVKTHTIPLETFTGIKLDCDANVFLISDSSKVITIKAQDNVAKNIEIKVRGEFLHIRYHKCITIGEPVNIYIPVKIIENLQINGSGNMETRGQLQAKNIELIINGSGNLKIKLTAESVISEVNGSGSIFLAGSAKENEVRINGSGNLEAAELPTESTEISVNGSGSCKVFAISRLKVMVRGSGDVVYKGSPDISSTIKGSGSVRKSNN